ncbi:DUF4260 domain-containing protein [Phenylobacterium aquaticum]|uniref:DUF4260 domain-containing protein n=1 Tax=Phenylobacterium aquaticum TaxID=1763816 RepID=UPI0026ED77D3|nr:DUF4260 domain-containing protein [Phenylobacterium aquaticum]
MSTLSPTAETRPARRAKAAPVPQTRGQAVGGPKAILRLEGGVVLAVAAAAYSQAGSGWMLFALLFLVPDVSMLGYLAGRRIGAVGYNLGHSYLGPAALGAYGLWSATPLAVSVALIWVAHIGFDRMLGYGLKYATGFKHTHLG